MRVMPDCNKLAQKITDLAMLIAAENKDIKTIADLLPEVKKKLPFMTEEELTLNLHTAIKRNNIDVDEETKRLRQHQYYCV